MNCEDITTLYKEGYDIGSHSMSHANLDLLSEKGMEYEIGGSKQCLLDHGINNPTSFAYPINTGAEDATVIDIVAKYYDIARRGDNLLMYLHCDGFKEKSSQTDCRTYSEDGALHFVNRYSIIGWSHDAERKANWYDDSEMLNKFIEVVNSQSIYNSGGTINAIPILIWHRIDNSGEGDPQVYATAIIVMLLQQYFKLLRSFRCFASIELASIGAKTKSINARKI